MENTVASISGYAFASIIQEASKCGSDSEGLLYGEVSKRNVFMISDSQSSGNREECDIAIQDTVSFEKCFSFYDASGSVLQSKLDGLESQGNMKLLGWYKIRRNSSARPSLREQAVIRRLAPGNYPHNGIVFLLVTPNTRQSLSTSTFSYKCFIGMKDRSPIGIQLKVINLGLNNSHPEYKMHSLLLPSPKNGASSIGTIYETAIHNFCDKHGQMFQVNNMFDLYSATFEQLKKNQEDLATSEDNIRHLRSDIEKLKERRKAMSELQHNEAEDNEDRIFHEQQAMDSVSEKSVPHYQDSELPQANEERLLDCSTHENKGTV